MDPTPPLSPPLSPTPTASTPLLGMRPPQPYQGRHKRGALSTSTIGSTNTIYQTQQLTDHFTAHLHQPPPRPSFCCLPSLTHLIHAWRGLPPPPPRFHPSTHPAILHRIIAECSPTALVSLRQASRLLHDLADKALMRHLVLTPGHISSPTGKIPRLYGWHETPGPASAADLARLLPHTKIMDVHAGVGTRFLRRVEAHVPRLEYVRHICGDVKTVVSARQLVLVSGAPETTLPWGGSRSGSGSSGRARARGSGGSHEGSCTLVVPRGVRRVVHTIRSDPAQLRLSSSVTELVVVILPPLPQRPEYAAELTAEPSDMDSSKLGLLRDLPKVLKVALALHGHCATHELHPAYARARGPALKVLLVGVAEAAAQGRLGLPASWMALDGEGREGVDRVREWVLSELGVEEGGPVVVAFAGVNEYRARVGERVWALETDV